MNNINRNHTQVREELAPGEMVNDFEIIEELGRGANGIVYRARQIQLAREIALKILPATKAADKEFVEKFFREARLAAKINHPAIVMVIDAGVSKNGIYFMAMELIDGETLDELVAKNGPIEFHQALKMAQEIAEGLDYAWRTQQLTHGDIKPANIIIDASGNAKLADLGLAKIADEKHSDDLMATPMFAAPEVCLFEFDKISFKSDIYSYACTLFFMFTGEAPFEEEDSDKVMQMHVSEKPPELIERLPFLPQNISDYIGKMLSKQTEERPEQWSGIVDFLRQARAELAQKEASGKKTPSPKTVFLITLIVILLAGAGLLFWYFTKDFEATSLEVQKKVPELSFIALPETPEPELELETEIKETQRALRLSIENRYRDIVEDANFQTKSFAELMEMQRELEKLRGQLKNNSHSSELNLSTIMTQITADLKLLPHLIAKKQAGFEKKRLHRALASFREKSPALPNGTLSPDINSTAQYFRALALIINRDTLTETVLQRQSPENREQLQFLKKHLQQSSSPQEIILRHRKNLSHQRLPWSWQGSRQWDIASIEPQKINLTRTVAGGGMFRSRMLWKNLKNHQIALLIENLVTSPAKNSLNSAECSALAGWLFRTQELEILKRVIASSKPMNEAERQRWQRFIHEVDNIGYELKTWTVWNQIRRFLRNKNYPQALTQLAVFTNPGSRGVLYSMLRPKAEQLIADLRWRYPEVQRQFVYREIKQMNPGEPGALSFCGTALARYYATRSGSEKNSLLDFRARALKSKKYKPGKFSVLPQNQPQSPGKLHQWMVQHYPKLNENSAIMQSALLDIGDWEKLAKNFKVKTILAKPFDDICKEFSLNLLYTNFYDLAFILEQYGHFDSAREKLATMLELLPETPDQRNVVTARLAITMRDYKTLETMLKTLRIENQTFIAYQLMLAGLLSKIQNQNFSERAFGRAIELLKIRFKTLNIAADWRILDFAQAVYQGKSATISQNDFEQCREPALLGRLCCDILARDIVLGRNSTKAGAVDAIIVPDSCYGADLWYRIALLKLLQNGPSLHEWRKSLKNLFRDYSFAALPNYPKMLMLKCFFELLEAQISLEQASIIYEHIIDVLPMASSADRSFAAALREPNRFHGHAYWTLLAITVSSELRADENPNKIFKNIREQHPAPLWQEILLERDLKTMLNAIKIQKSPLK